MCRILSLDGGGSWALIEAQALAEIFGSSTDGHRILEHFDLVVANSGGSIIAAGLAAGYSPGKMVDLLMSEERRRAIFVPRADARFARATGLFPRYQAAAKQGGLRALFDGVTGFADASMDAWTAAHALPRFVILGFDYDRQRERFFRSYSASRAASDTVPPVTFVQAVNASSTAPVLYFDHPVEIAESRRDGSTVTRRYWDGAMGGYNNPIMAGITEALSNGHPSEEIRALSLGTATVEKIPAALRDGLPDQFIEKPQPDHWYSAIGGAVTCILDDPPDAATFVAHVVLGGKVDTGVPSVKVVRMNPLMRPVRREGTWRMPAGFEETLPRLQELQMDAVKQDEVLLIKQLGEAWIRGEFDNQPIREGDHLECQIGSPTFPEALKCLRQWLPEEPPLEPNERPEALRP